MMAAAERGGPSGDVGPDSGAGGHVPSEMPLQFSLMYW